MKIMQQVQDDAEWRRELPLHLPTLITKDYADSSMVLQGWYSSVAHALRTEGREHTEAILSQCQARAGG